MKYLDHPNIGEWCEVRAIVVGISVHMYTYNAIVQYKGILVSIMILPALMCERWF